MRVVHEPADGDSERTIATRVDTADTVAEQAKGLMGREDLPAEYALVFRFEDPPTWMPARLTNWRSIHMLFVRVPLDVLWVLDGTVTKVASVPPWVGLGLGRGDTVIELPAGAADDVAAGDSVRLEEGTE